MIRKEAKKSVPRTARGRKPEGAEDIRALTKVSGGASYAITLPRSVIKGFKWKERQKLKLVVDMKKQTILIRDWKK